MGLFFVFHILYSLFFPSKCFVQMSYCFLVSFDFVSSFHFGHDVVEVDACVFPEDEEVVEEVAGFGNDFFFVFVFRLYFAKQTMLAMTSPMPMTSTQCR